MTWATTDSYKVLIARMILGEAVDVVPATVHVGNGATFTEGVPDPPASSNVALTNELASALLDTLTRVTYTATGIGTIPGGGSPMTINEVAFKTAAGTMIARATFEPVTFQGPFNYEATLELQPEY